HRGPRPTPSASSHGTQAVRGPLPLSLGRTPRRGRRESVPPGPRRSHPRSIPGRFRGNAEPRGSADDLPAGGAAPLRGNRPNRGHAPRVEGDPVRLGGGAAPVPGFSPPGTRASSRAAPTLLLEPAGRGGELRERAPR